MKRNRRKKIEERAVRKPDKLAAVNTKQEYKQHDDFRSAYAASVDSDDCAAAASCMHAHSVIQIPAWPVPCPPVGGWHVSLWCVSYRGCMHERATCIMMAASERGVYAGMAGCLACMAG